MSEIVWLSQKGRILTVAAGRSLGSVLRRIDEDLADWVVVVRTRPGSKDIYYYAFRSAELQRLAGEFPERKAWLLEQAVDMHEWTSSATTRGERPMGPDQGQQGPAARRVVDLDAEGRIAAIGERDATRGIDLGPMRGGRSRGDAFPRAGVRAERPEGTPAAAPGAEIDLTLSAETRAEIQIGRTESVAFQMELALEATPLRVSQGARAKPDVPIVVSLSVENDAIEILEGSERRLDPPGPKEPRRGSFVVRGMRAAVSRLAVAFRQGGSELGTIGLAVEVVDAEAKSAPAQGTATAAPRDPSDDDKLALLIEQRTEGGQVFYEYILHSEALDLPYMRLRSKPLLDRGNGPAATPQAFVERIYERVTKELKSVDDLNALQREARALGVNLCRELFDPAVANVLWPLRSRINFVQIVSWEPYVPWELVRLRDPASGAIDDRFLAEYGLVRTLSDKMPPRALPMAKWSYLGAAFPMGTYPAVGAELDYFTSTSPQSLRGRGITPSPIAATRDAFYDAVAKGDFDVLHISCHGESQHQSIDRASLIIGDETPPGSSQSRLVEVDTITVEAEAQLKQRQPMVFLNACETGKAGAVLTAWGGWPNVFLRAGAGAFVGTAWAVRDKPAAAFSTAFYNAMLDGKTLAEAANAARASAKQLGDASWLAFKVYGHPRARRG